jgi:hypothetical protein
VPESTGTVGAFCYSNKYKGHRTCEPPKNGGARMSRMKFERDEHWNRYLCGSRDRVPSN